jgi:VanZ family protein
MSDQDSQARPNDTGRRPRVAVVLWLAWALLLAVWTVGLLSPTVPHLAEALVPAGARFSLGKVTHVATYAVLACVACWLPARWGIRAAAWLLLLGHGAVTEYLQQFVEGRSGQLSDVGLDAVGILGGILLGLLVRWLRRRA